MKITPTPLTAAIAGAVSAAAWPQLWPLLKDSQPSSTTWLVLGTLIFIALPAHALVVGFRREAAPAGQAVDQALLKRIGAWLASAVVCSALFSLN